MRWGIPTSRLMLCVMVNDFLNDEVQKFLGKFRVEVGPSCKIFQPRNLRGFAGGILGWQRVLCLQFSDGFCVF